MATKAMNLLMEETDIANIKSVGSVYHMTLSEIIRNGTREYVARLMNDPFYKLTVNVMDADEEESAEILEAISELSDDDLSIASVKRVSI